MKINWKRLDLFLNSPLVKRVSRMDELFAGPLGMADVIPWGWGECYKPLTTHTTYYAIFPLNLVIRWFYDVRRYFRTSPLMNDPTSWAKYRITHQHCFDKYEECRKQQELSHQRDLSELDKGNAERMVLAINQARIEGMLEVKKRMEDDCRLSYREGHDAGRLSVLDELATLGLRPDPDKPSL